MIKKEAQNSSGDKRGFFYGYVVVLLALCIMIVIFGTRFAFGVFFKPLATEFSWSSAETSGAFSLSIVLEGTTAVVMGALTDKFGPRIVLTLSSFVLAIGYLAMSQVSALWQLYLFYGVIIGIGMSGFFVPLVTTIPRWFTKRRGIMTGVVLSGTGLGTLIAAPTANWLIYTYGWQTSFLVLGGIIIIIVPVAAQFLRRDPLKAGLLPYGEHESTDTGAFALHEATHTLQFWLITLMFACLGFCIYATNVHTVPSAIERGISAADSANVLAILGGMSILGRIVLGNIGDRVGSRRALIVGLVLMALALFWMTQASHFWALCLFAIVFGFGYGGATAVQSPLVAEFFGLKSHGLIFGMCGIGFTIGGAIGPFIIGYMFDITQSYQTPFLVAGVLSIIGVVFTMVVKPLKRI